MSIDNPRLRIGYLVVEALAAWQAADQAQDLFPETLKANGTFCTPENFKGSPRDCLLITVASNLAAQDQTWRNFAEKKAELKTMSIPYPATGKKVLHEWFTSFKERFKSLKEMREKAYKSAEVPAGFWKQFDKQILAVFCNAREVPIYFARTDGTVLDPATQKPVTRDDLWGLINDLAWENWTDVPNDAAMAKDYFATKNCGGLDRLSYKSAS